MDNRRSSPPKIKKPLRPGSARDGYASRYGKRDSGVPLAYWIVGGVVVLIVFAGCGALLFNFWGGAQPTAQPTVSQPPNSPSMAAGLASPFPVVTDTPAAPTPLAIDAPRLQQYMFDLINQDRRAQGLSALRWDDIAASAGASHAREMTTFRYMSHWNLDGYGPEYRYTQSGGLNILRENVYSYIHSPGGGPKSAQDWDALIQSAEKALMDSPGHHDNILDPAHTHVGVGVSYDAVAGRLSIAQEFVDKYVSVQPLPTGALLDQTIEINGKLATGLSDPIINLAYEPLPAPKSVEELNQTSSYTSAAQIYQVIPLRADANGNFSEKISFNNQNQAGLYHIYIGVSDQFGADRLIFDFVVKVSSRIP